MRHDGGDLDWYTVDAGPPRPAARPARAQSGVPGPPALPGRAAAALVADRGRQGRHRRLPAGPARLATVLLIDLIVNHSDDWFTIPGRAAAGNIVTLDDVVVLDSFGENWELGAPTDWSLFATQRPRPPLSGRLGHRCTPLVGPVVDEVVVGMDEDANLVWAVERRLRGRDVPADADPPPEPPAHRHTGRKVRLPAHDTGADPWHPYIVEDINAAAGKCRAAPPTCRAAASAPPPPVQQLLYDPAPAR